MLQRSRVAGIIFISGEDITEKDLNDGIAKVFVDRIPWNAKSSDAVTIEVDNYVGGQLAAGELLDAGCRRIAALFDARGLNSQVARYSGFVRAHQERGVDIIRELYRPVTQVSFQEGYTATKALLKSGLPFDGIFCYADTLACGALRALKDANISVPEQIQVTGYDNISSGQWGMPALTTIEQPIAEMGQLAAELILKMSKGKPLDQKNYILPVRLIRRESTKKQS